MCVCVCVKKALLLHIQHNSNTLKHLVPALSSVAIWNKFDLMEVDGEEESDGGAHETTIWQELCQGLRIFS